MNARHLAPLCTLLLLSSRADAQSIAERRADDPDGNPVVWQLEPGETFPVDRSGGPASWLGGGACPTPTQSFLSTGDDPEGDSPSGVCFTPDGSKIVVAHRDSHNLVVFDAATRAFLQAIPVSGSPNAVAVSSDGVHAVTANLFEDTASIVDLTTGAEIATVGVGTLPSVARVTPDGTKAVIGNVGSQELSVIDIASATELLRIPGTGFTATLSFAPEPGVFTYAGSKFECVDDDTAIVPDFFNDTIDFFDLSTGTVNAVASDADPRGISITADGTTAVVVHTFSVRRISVVDTASETISKTIATSVDLWGPVAVNPAATKAACLIQNATVVVDLVTDAVSASLNTASLGDLLTTADGLYALGIGFRGPLISFASQSIVVQLNNLVSTPLGAVSPSGSRGVMIANTFGEDMLVVNTAGGAGFLEGQASSGPPPEADSTRKVAISADGTRAVTTNVLSDTASIIDLTTGTVEAIVAVGNRPADVEITPDGSTAVVANLDSTFASVIDLDAQTVSSVTISTRASEVEISPDGQYAYLAVVASGDGVWRINLQTLATAGPKRLTGNMGSVGYAFWQASGMTLSHDGETLAVCGSFDNSISVIDTSSWLVVATVPVGSFPVRAAFSQDDDTIYVANRDSDSISVVSNAGAASMVTDTISVGDWPFEMAPTQDGSKLYVANFLDENIGVVDLGSGTMTSTIPVTENPVGLALSPTGSCLYASSGTYTITFGASVLIIDLIGSFGLIDVATDTLVQALDTGLPPSMLVADPAGTTALASSPLGDGLTVLELQETIGSRYCAPVPNSTGLTGRMTVNGSTLVADDELRLTATQLPTGPNIGYFIMGTGTNTFVPPGSSGPICVTPGLKRYLPPVNNTSQLPGGFSRAVGTSGSVSSNITAGSTWNFQAWHRDGTSPSNLTDAVSVDFL